MLLNALPERGVTGSSGPLVLCFVFLFNVETNCWVSGYIIHRRISLMTSVIFWIQISGTWDTGDTFTFFTPLQVQLFFSRRLGSLNTNPVSDSRVFQRFRSGRQRVISHDFPVRSSYSPVWAEGYPFGI